MSTFEERLLEYFDEIENGDEKPVLVVKNWDNLLAFIQSERKAVVEELKEWANKNYRFTNEKIGMPVIDLVDLDSIETEGLLK